LVAAALLVAGLVGVLPARAAEPPRDQPPGRSAAADPVGQISVLTRNLFVGAELRPVLSATDQPTFQTAIRKALDRIADNRYPLRAVALAQQIAKAKPDVVALQEVYDLRRDGAHASGPYQDQLALLLGALKLFGDDYELVAQVQTLSTTFPVDLDRNGSLETQVGITDRDVLLVRKGILAKPTPFPSKCARPVLDGCVYQIVDIAEGLPNGRVIIEQGWVGVDLLVNDRVFRVVTTRVEDRDRQVSNTPGPVDPLFARFQSFQTSELITQIEAMPAAPIVIVLGDLASRPEDEAVLFGTLPVVPPYIILRTNDFRDAASLDPSPQLPGHTCCRAENLRSKKPQLSRRVDHVFVTGTPIEVQTDVLADTSLDRLLAGRRWPSDHLAVYAKLRY
jgi:endonuclease/exonuclease/phosphatase family metal-dependent hydrolase